MSALERLLWDGLAVSFDVFFQRFRDGDAEPGGGNQMREVLAPYMVTEEPEHNFALVQFGDGSADVYLDQSDTMANHISGEDPWDLLVRGAWAADWVILPVGCPTCITNDSQRAELPDVLRQEVTLVTTGAVLLAAIQLARS